MTLSTIIITKNEADMIEGCLQSVAFSDEIIVLDSGSTDKTVELAKRYTHHVEITDWPGFGKQKNRALKEATKDWVLSIDADERITPALSAEIQNTISQAHTPVAFYIKRHSFFLGKRIRFGDWMGEKVIRLFKRDQACFDDAPVHEKVIVSGEMRTLKAPMLHYSYRDQADIDKKVSLYAQVGFEKLKAAGKKSTPLKVVLKALWTFTRGYFLKLGFLDGSAGLKVALMNTRYTYKRYRLLSKDTQ